MEITQMNRTEILEALNRVLHAQEYPKLQKMVAQIHEADIAAFIDELPPREAALVFRLLPKTEGAEVFATLDLFKRAFEFRAKDVAQHPLILSAFTGE